MLVASLAERGQSRACSLQRKSLVLSRELTSAPLDAQIQQGCRQPASWRLAAGPSSHLPLKWPQQQAHSVFFSPVKHCVCRHLQDPRVWRPEHSARFSPIKNMHKVLTLGIKSLQKAAAEGQGREGSCFSLGGFALFCSCLYFQCTLPSSNSTSCLQHCLAPASSNMWHEADKKLGTDP